WNPDRPGWPLLLFVDERTFLSWPIWIPPRFGDDLSIIAQFQRALSENFAVAFRQSANLASSNRPCGVGRPLLSARSMYCCVDPIERRVYIQTRVRITDMQNLIVQ